MAVLLAVTASLLRMGTLVEWEMQIPVIGRQISVTGLSDMQWHFFAIMVMLGGAYAARHDSHVRVDFLYARLSDRGKDLVNVIGHVIFLLPFCVLMTWLSIAFIRFSFVSGEGSDYGGLVDRWIIKTTLPIGFTLLGLVGAAQVIQGMRRLLSRGLR